MTKPSHERLSIDIRKGMPPRTLDRECFEKRFLSAFIDPCFDALRQNLKTVVDAAWDAYSQGRKAPFTRKAGLGFADPDYELAVDWLAARDAIMRAESEYNRGPPRILLVNGSSRTEHTCPGEMSKTWRLVDIARNAIAHELPGAEVNVLDLSRTASEFGKTIHPCKSCASTSMALCHWPCSCYPNYSLGQAYDWMNEIYPLWVAAHGIMVITPVWYQAPSPLKAMMDRLVCADGGNPDPTSTHGKKADEAKALELAGWPYPRHLAGRLFSVIVHGDTRGAETLRRIMVDWAADMHLTSAGSKAEVDAYIGYFEPYATSHHALDRDHAFQEEVRQAALVLAEAVRAKLNGKFEEVGARLKEPRPK